MAIHLQEVVLVTGSSSGFGRLTVETLARQGYRVFAGVRQSHTKNLAVSQELEELAVHEQLALEVVELDVTSDTSVEQAIEHIIQEVGRIDVVVNNAGILATGPLEAYSLKQVEQLFDTNVFSVIRVNRAVLPHMRSQGSGLLIGLSSLLGRQALPFVGLYSATKFAIEGLSEAYWYELAALSIDVVIVEPTAYPTKMLTNTLPAADTHRIGAYTPFLAKLSETMDSAGQGEDPQQIADTIAMLIATPAGRRPLRTVLAPAGGSRDGIEAINNVSKQLTQATVKAAGWETFTVLKQA